MPVSQPTTSHILSALLLIWVHADGLDKTAEAGPRAWICETQMGDLEETHGPWLWACLSPAIEAI